MVIRGMPLFWTIFNPLDLQCPIVLWLAGVAVGCFDSTTSAFHHGTTTMNPTAVATFFYKTCRVIFNYLLRVGSSNSSFFGPVSVYFGTIETNGWGMLYLYCLIWLKKMSSFFDFCRKIANKDGFKTKLLSFLDQVIRCKLTLVDINTVLSEVGPLVLTAKNASVFISKLKDDANLIAF